MNLFQRFKNLFAPKPLSTKQFAELSFVGHRHNNQDYVAHHFSTHGKLFIVADGLGGHEGGELASEYFSDALITIVSDYFSKLNKKPEATLIELAEQAAQLMTQKLQTEYPDIKAHTTCAICWLSSNRQLTTLHIGDTRIYRFTRQKLLWQSRDHSVAQMRIEKGEIKESQRAYHPDQAALTRSISVARRINPSCKLHTKKMKRGEALLLCTDGLWEKLNQNEILSLAKSKDATKDLNRWIKTAIDRAQPHSDNVSAQLFIL